MDPRQSAEEEVISKHDVHARLLLAVHEEFLEFGLKLSSDDDSESQTPQAACFTQSSTGAFPPLRYNDVGGGRLIVVQGLAMFDELIVSATAAPAEALAEDFQAQRRVVLSTNMWAAAAAAPAPAPAPATAVGGGEEQPRPQVKMALGLVLCAGPRLRYPGR